MDDQRRRQIIALARNDTSVQSFRDLARRVNVSYPTVCKHMKLAQEYNALEGFFALRKWRAQEKLRKMLLSYLARLAVRLGRTPDRDDINDDGVWTATHFIYHFGCLYHAQELAGLVPNDYGTPGHRDHRSSLKLRLPDKRRRQADVATPRSLPTSRTGRMRQGAQGFTRLRTSAA